MSYTKTTWSNGDVITGEKLNNIESGVESANSGSILIVHDVENTLDKTWQEIYDVVNNKIPVYIWYNWNESDDNYGVDMVRVVSVYHSNNDYVVVSDGYRYYANSSSDYPMQGSTK